MLVVEIQDQTVKDTLGFKLGICNRCWVDFPLLCNCLASILFRILIPEGSHGRSDDTVDGTKKARVDGVETGFDSLAPVCPIRSVVGLWNDVRELPMIRRLTLESHDGRRVTVDIEK